MILTTRSKNHQAGPCQATDFRSAPITNTSCSRASSRRRPGVVTTDKFFLQPDAERHQFIDLGNDAVLFC